jgi:hypothetical protein
MVGAASAAVLHAPSASGGCASAADGAAQLDLARQCGFEAVHSADVRCATELGPLLRTQWPHLCERLRARAATATAASQPPPSFLALVGDRRRDEIFNILGGLQADGTPLASAAAGSDAATPIPAEQIVVYQTIVAEGPAAAHADTEDGASSSETIVAEGATNARADTEDGAGSAELSTFLQQLLSQLAELDAELPAPLPWAAWAAPSTA